MKLIDLIDKLIEKFGDKTAVITCDHAISYYKLKENILKTAGALRDLGLDQGDAVCVNTGNVLEYIYTLFACSVSGLSFVPIDTRCSRSETTHILECIKPKIYITSNNQPITDADCKVIELNSWSKIIESSPAVSENNIYPDSSFDFIILFSSGSTGISKGAAHSEESMCLKALNYAHSAAIGHNDVSLTTLPISHSYALGSALLPSLVSGATIILEDNFVPRRLLKIIKEYGVTIFFGVKFIYKMLLETGEDEDIKSIRIAFSGAGPLDMETYSGFYKKYGIKINVEYGSTETGPVCLDTGNNILNGIFSVGKPLTDVHIKIVDDTGSELPLGETGTIIVKSKQLMRNYIFSDSQEQHDFQTEWFFTQDMGFFDDYGNLYITGRKNAAVNIGGLKVHPAEIENVLMRHDEIIDVCVVGELDRDNNEYIKAFIVPKGRQLTQQDIISFCSGRLAAYKVPKVIEFVKVIPRNSMGKVLKDALSKNQGV